MKSSIRIAIIGDYDSNRLRQTATTAGLDHAAKKIGVKLEAVWLPTTQIGIKTEELLSDFDAYFGAPGAVVSLEGTLRGIKFARESNKPYLGTCAGFQYAVLEFARNAMGIEKATSAEFDPNSSQLVLSELSCQIAGKKMRVRIMPDTLAYKLYGTREVTEEHYCHYGINSQFTSTLQQEGMKISATDEVDEPRIIELSSKGFYLATLFVPQTSSTPTNPHPLLVGYLKAILN
jgi:CTP synthase (UTP-ammonia lyase)